ncbi:ABC transporter ATP-binding protein [Shimia sp.]|uniref:ABC transporter ATP-binding protein n=1 Tax=Shimia sp. TaxID=1954381 RepID=UPI003B8CDB06
MSAAIDIKDAAFTWRGKANFSLSISRLEIPAGERVFLLGESGSGKSTLLSLICGINCPDSGSVSVDGVDLGQLPASQRDRFRAENIGVIFQMFNLLPYVSPLENILLPLAFSPPRRRRLSDPRTEALKLTAALGLSEALVVQADTTELSIGQQQRVAAARALIGKPRLIIADEPTSSLDASAQKDFISLLMTQTEQVGATLVMVSHDSRLASKFDRSLELTDVAEITRGAA